MNYRLLDEFRGLFEGKRYQHRDSSRGDWVAYHLYEDLFTINKSHLLVDRIQSHEHVLAVTNKRQGVTARRGDGTFGELVPGVVPSVAPGFLVARGPIANVEIGAEAKILAKAMIKQIDRVITDLTGQVAQFRRGAGTPICVGIVGVNQSPVYTSYEGRVTCPRCGEVFALERLTDGKKYLHPIQEAVAAESHLVARVRPAFDEFLVLRFRSTNQAPYPFEWVDYDTTFRDYGAILTRVSRTYDTRFSSPTSKKNQVPPARTRRRKSRDDPRDK